MSWGVTVGRNTGRSKRMVVGCTKLKVFILLYFIFICNRWEWSCPAVGGVPGHKDWLVDRGDDKEENGVNMVSIPGGGDEHTKGTCSGNCIRRQDLHNGRHE